MKIIIYTFILALIMCLNINLFAQINLYTFSQPSGTYIEITGDTTVAFATGTGASIPESIDDVVYDSNYIPFQFNFNGSIYKYVTISSNGFITFGGDPTPVTYNPISTSAFYNGAVTGFGNDLIGTRGITGTTTNGSNIITGVDPGQFVGIEIGRIITGTGIPVNTTITSINPSTHSITISANATASGTNTFLIASGSIVRSTIGSGTNHIHTIQFKNFRNFTTGPNSNCINFQIKLYETSNVIEIIYGKDTASTNVNGQVGLRGSTNSDFNNRTTSSNWSATTAGVINSAACMMSLTVMPSSGLIFRWTPRAINDVGTMSIIKPISGINIFSATIAPKSEIKNFGTGNQVSPFNVTCTINPGGYVSTKSTTLSAGATTNINFDSSFVPIIGTEYTVTVFTSLASDVNRSNDTLRQSSVFIYQNYGNDSGYFYANTLATNQVSYPKYSWKDTSGSKNLILNGNQATGTTLVGSLDDGYLKLSLKDILNSLNINSTDKHFKYNGMCFDSIFPGTNGIIGFTENFGSTTISVFEIDGSLVPKNTLLPLWKDFDFGVIGNGALTNRLSYKATGSEVIITYDRLTSFNSHDQWVSFQVIIEIVSGCGNANSNFRYTYADTTTGQTSGSFVNNYLSSYDSIPGSSTQFGNYIIGYSKNGAPIAYSGYVSSGNPFPASPQTQLSLKRPAYNLSSEIGLAIEFGANQNSLNKYEGLILRLSVAFEGLQNNSQTRTRDTVTVILRDGSGTPYGTIQTTKVYLDSVSAGTKKFGRKSISFSLLERSNSYYIVVKQRNSISSWSNSVSTSADTLIYDFTTGLSQTFGNNAVIVNNAASFFTGDINQDGAVDINDAGSIDNDVFNIATGSYLVTDLNWDGIVDVSDAALVDNNEFNFVAEVKPPGALLANQFNYREQTETIVLPDLYMIGKIKEKILKR